MKNLFESSDAEEIKRRIGQLGTSNERQWGKMNVAQALAHCSAAMEWAVGDAKAPRVFIGRIVGQLIKKKVVGDDEPLRRNVPTAKTLVIDDARDLSLEKNRLVGLIDRFHKGGPVACTTDPHCFFGKLTPSEWAVLTYKHLDHHLRQFGG